MKTYEDGLQEAIVLVKKKIEIYTTKGTPKPVDDCKIMIEDILRIARLSELSDIHSKLELMLKLIPETTKEEPVGFLDKNGEWIYVGDSVYAGYFDEIVKVKAIFYKERIATVQWGVSEYVFSWKALTKSKNVGLSFKDTRGYTIKIGDMVDYLYDPYGDIRITAIFPEAKTAEIAWDNSSRKTIIKWELLHKSRKQVAQVTLL